MKNNTGASSKRMNIVVWKYVVLDVCIYDFDNCMNVSMNEYIHLRINLRIYMHVLVIYAYVPMKADN